MNERVKSPFDRRDFLKVAAGGVGALMAGSTTAQTQIAAKPAADASAAGPASLPAVRPGSDFMIDVIKQLDFEYVSVNPGANFRGLMESAVNYGGNKNPQLITALHEEVAVAMAHGYFKIEGKPMGVFMYGTVGIQHAVMAIYSAWCDRVPVVMFVGNDIDMADRSNRVDMMHSAQDVGALVRSMTKWDDAPVSLNGFAEAAMRGYKIAMTPPYGPVVIAADKYMQEGPIPEGSKLVIPKYSPTKAPQGDEESVVEAARMLVNAEFPVIIAERAARTEAGLKYMVELAELLQAGVVDTIQRMNFPSRHPLRQTGGVVSQADVILSLENPLLWSAVHAPENDDFGAPASSPSRLQPGAKLITISSLDLFSRSNYQDFGRYQAVDLSIGADAEETLPALIEQVKRQMTSNRKAAIQARGAKLAAAHARADAQARTQAAFGWNESPISTARVAAELWAQIKDKDWSLIPPAATAWPDGRSGCGASRSFTTTSVSSDRWASAILSGRGRRARWPVRIWPDLHQPAERRRMLTRLCSSVLWTAAHYQVPMLTIMHNNRSYNTEFMEIEICAGREHRDISAAAIPTKIDNPPIDFAKLAQSMGWYAEGPIENPSEVGPAIKRALAVVEKGQPALLDTVTQPT